MSSDVVHDPAFLPPALVPLRVSYTDAERVDLCITNSINYGGEFVWVTEPGPSDSIWPAIVIPEMLLSITMPNRKGPPPMGHVPVIMLDQNECATLDSYRYVESSAVEPVRNADRILERTLHFLVRVLESRELSYLTCSRAIDALTLVFTRNEERSALAAIARRFFDSSPEYLEPVTGASSSIGAFDCVILESRRRRALATQWVVHNLLGRHIGMEKMGEIATIVWKWSQEMEMAEERKVEATTALTLWYVGFKIRRDAEAAARSAGGAEGALGIPGLGVVSGSLLLPSVPVVTAQPPAVTAELLAAVTAQPPAVTAELLAAVTAELLAAVTAQPSAAVTARPLECAPNPLETVAVPSLVDAGGSSGSKRARGDDEGSDGRAAYEGSRARAASSEPPESKLPDANAPKLKRAKAPTDPKAKEAKATETKATEAKAVEAKPPRPHQAQPPRPHQAPRAQAPRAQAPGSAAAASRRMDAPSSEKRTPSSSASKPSKPTKPDGGARANANANRAAAAAVASQPPVPAPPRSKKKAAHPPPSGAPGPDLHRPSSAPPPLCELLDPDASRAARAPLDSDLFDPGSSPMTDPVPEALAARLAPGTPPEALLWGRSGRDLLSDDAGGELSLSAAAIQLRFSFSSRGSRGSREGFDGGRSGARGTLGQSVGLPSERDPALEKMRAAPDGGFHACLKDQGGVVVSHAEAGPGDRAAGPAAAAAGLDLGPWIRWTRQTARGKALDAEDADASYHSQTFAAFARDPATGRVVIGRVVEKTFDHETLRRRRRRRRRRRTTEEEGGGGVAAAAAAAREASSASSASSASGEDSGDDSEARGHVPSGGALPRRRPSSGCSRPPPSRGRAEWSYDVSAETHRLAGVDVLELVEAVRRSGDAHRGMSAGERECAWALHLRSGLEMRFRFLRFASRPPTDATRPAGRGGSNSAGRNAAIPPAWNPYARERENAAAPRHAWDPRVMASRPGNVARAVEAAARDARREEERALARERAERIAAEREGEGEGGLADEDDAAASDEVFSGRVFSLTGGSSSAGAGARARRRWAPGPDGCDLRHVSAGTLLPLRVEPHALGSVTTAYAADGSKAARECPAHVVWYAVPRTAARQLHEFIREHLSSSTDRVDGPRVLLHVASPPPSATALDLLDAGDAWLDPDALARWNAGRSAARRVPVTRHVQRAGEHFVVDPGAFAWGTCVAAAWLATARWTGAREWLPRAREMDKARAKLERAEELAMERAGGASGAVFPGEAAEKKGGKTEEGNAVEDARRRSLLSSRLLSRRPLLRPPDAPPTFDHRADWGFAAAGDDGETAERGGEDEKARARKGRRGGWRRRGKVEAEAFAAQFSAWTLEARREEMDEEEKRREKGAETGLGCSSADE